MEVFTEITLVESKVNIRTLNDYKKLKRIIKTLLSSSSDKTQFFFSLERELEKVNGFYLRKEVELKQRLNLLIEKRGIGEVTSLREAYDLFIHDLNRLQKFAELNEVGFIKILKKWDKRSKSSTREIYLSRQVEIQPCFNKEVLGELADMALREYNDLKSIKQEDTNLYECITLGHLSKLEQLVSEQMDLSKLFWKLCKNVEVKSKEAIDLILPKVDFKWTDDINKRTCLHQSCKHGNIELLKVALAHDADVNAMDMYGKQPLHYAAMYGHAICVQLMIENGAEINSNDHYQNTPLVYAVKGGHCDSVDLLRESFNWAAVAVAASHGHAKIVQLLLHHVELVENDEMNPIHTAARAGNADILQLLISKGINVNAIEKSLNSWTALFFACSEGHELCAKILLDAGADACIKDDNGWTCRDYAVFAGHDNVAALFPKPIEYSPMQETIPQNDIEQMPSLLLPPPVIPCRVYGHHFLESKCQIQIEITGVSFNAPTTHYSSMKMNVYALDSHSDSFLEPAAIAGLIPYSLMLPLTTNDELYTFPVDNPYVSIAFDLLPTFGNRLIGKAVALPFNFTRSLSNGNAVIPILDSSLSLIGEVSFVWSVITPFRHGRMRIDGSVDTYWKSTKPLHRGNSVLMSPSLFMVTSSSLRKNYKLVKVSQLKDGVPVVVDTLEMQIGGVNLPIQLLDSKHVGLSLLRKVLDEEDAVAVEIVSAQANLNSYIDAILETVYDSGKAVVFLSLCKDICSSLNWKQPNFPVFKKTQNLKESIAVAKHNNLLGLVIDKRLAEEKATELVLENGLVLGIESGTHLEFNENVVN